MKDENKFLKSKKIIEEFTSKMFKRTIFFGIILSAMISSLTLLTESPNLFVLGVIFTATMLAIIISFFIFLNPIIKITHIEDYLIYMDGIEEYEDKISVEK